MINNEFFIQSLIDLAKGQSVSHITTLLAKKIMKGVIITDINNRVLAFYNPLENEMNPGGLFPVDNQKTGDLEDVFLANGEHFHKGQWETETGLVDYIYLPIKIQEEFYGNCIVLSSAEELTLEQEETVQLASLVLLIAIKKASRKDWGCECFLNEIIYDILNNNYGSKFILYEKASHLPWSMEGSYIVIVVKCSPNQLQAAKRLGPAQFNSFPPVYTVVDDCLVIVLSLKDLANDEIREAIKNFIKDLSKSLALSRIGDVQMGLGSIVDSLTELHQSFREAKIALKLGQVFGLGSINCFTEMGFLKFIFSAPA